MPAIGQESTAVTAVKSVLATDGEMCITNDLAALMPWTALPVIDFFVHIIIDYVVNLFITQIDNVAFAGYVATKTGKQVSDYILAQDSGNQQSVDQSADGLIKLTN